MWEEYFIYSMANIAIPAGVGTVFNNLQPGFRLDTDADFKLWKLAYFATSGNIRVRIRDDMLGRYFSKFDMGLPSIAGNFIGTPFIMPEPYRFAAGTSIIVEIADASGFANVLRLTLHGAKINPGIAPWEESPGKMKRYRNIVTTIYNTGLQTIAAGSTVSVTIPVDNDAPFLAKKLTGINYGVPGTILVDVKNTAPDMGHDNWGSAPIPFECLFGNGQFPNILYNYKYVGRLKVIQINCQNTAAIAANVEMNFAGIKLFE
jgi:hypothetical protein